MSCLKCLICLVLSGFVSIHFSFGQDKEPYLVYDGKWSDYKATSISHYLDEQKVGLVLSGGGAKGLAHIGVIKALEENEIPIDYLTGTSMGAIVGGMYAIGMTPDEMKKMATSSEFINIAMGEIDEKYKFYFNQQDPNSSWLSLKIAKDSIWETSLPTSYINPVGIDFLMMEKTAGASAAANYNFDSLLVPFRCVASDIQSKSVVVLREGHLSEAIRASATFPFYMMPISIGNKLLFDGGLYNNFPTNVMYNEFYPDIIIGSNVAVSLPPPSANNLISQIKSMLVRREVFSVICDNGILIEPKHEAGTFSFSESEVESIIDSGYSATIAKMAEIKNAIKKRLTVEEMNAKRKKFKDSEPELLIDQVYVDGLTTRQSKYVRDLLIRKKDDKTPLEDIKLSYFRIFEDDKISSIFPRAEYNRFTGRYDLYLDIKKDKEIKVDIGGIISNRPLSGTFLGLQYNHLGGVGVSASLCGYLGKLYSSVQIKTRVDFPIRLPVFVEPVLTYNRWDYFKSSTAFFDNETPSYLVQQETFAGLEVGFPVKNNGRCKLGSYFADLRDEYYQTKIFSKIDTADRTDFNVFTSHIIYEKNSLNQKQYANEGTYMAVKAIHNIGEEYETPGTTSINNKSISTLHQWVQFKLIYDSYYKSKGTLKLGVYFEGVYSTQELFNNYTASILRAPAFQPTPESKTLFLESFRAHKYAAFGQKVIIQIKKNIDLRLEGYLFQPYRSIIKQDTSVVLGEEFGKIYTIATGSLVYNSPIGPLSISLNYYHNLPEIAQEDKTPLTFFFHFGYIIFNRRAIE